MAGINYAIDGEQDSVFTRHMPGMERQIITLKDMLVRAVWVPSSPRPRTLHLSFKNPPGCFSVKVSLDTYRLYQVSGQGKTPYRAANAASHDHDSGLLCGVKLQYDASGHTSEMCHIIYSVHD